MVQDLPLDPLERVVDRLRVAAELPGHRLVRAALEIESKRVGLERRECRAEAPDEAAAYELPEVNAASDHGEPEQAAGGLPTQRTALLSTFLSEVNVFLEKLSWMLSDEDAQHVASNAPRLAALSRSVGVLACAEALEELERSRSEGMLKASDTSLRRCYEQGLCAAREVQSLLAEQRRAA